MSMTMHVIIDVLLAIGVFFVFVGVLGVIRMPDVFGRLQASTCIPSLGNIFLIAGGIVAVLSFMVVVSNPVSNHAICKAACKMGVLPVNEMVIDDYKEDDPE